MQNYEQDIDGTPCQLVVEKRRVVHLADRIFELYPDDPNIRRHGAVSYMGVPLTDLDGTILGHLAVMDTKPMPEEPLRLALFEIFAARAAAELRRLRVEAEVRGAPRAARAPGREHHGRHRATRRRAGRAGHEPCGGADVRKHRRARPGSAARQHFTLILRNVNDRLEAERRIATLTDEAEYLRAELRELGKSREI